MTDFIGLSGNDIKTKSAEETTKPEVEVKEKVVPSEEEINMELDDSTVPSNKVPTPRHTIQVNLTDTRSPIVFLFGAKSGGKTMTLIRLAKYLRPLGYKLLVDSNFCNIWEYKENKSKFNKMLDTEFAMKGTNYNDFLLIKVLDNNGNTVCQILEGAGEDYFPLTVEGGSRSQIAFPKYMAKLFASTNKKIWMFLTEPDWEEDRSEYVNRIDYCVKNFMSNKDKCIIIYNKVDTTPFAVGDKVNKKAAMNQCNGEYPLLFSKFRNHSPLPEFLVSKYSCEFIPFSTGTYGKAPQGADIPYTPSKEMYPRMLWDTIKKCIKG